MQNNYNIVTLFIGTFIFAHPSESDYVSLSFGHITTDTDNTTIVIVGSDGKIATSTNGTSFTVRAIDGNPTIYLRGVACDVIGAGMR